MIKKLMLAVAAMIVTMGFAFAQVDVNKADAADPEVLDRITRHERHSIVVSARTGQGMKELLALIAEELPRPHLDMTLLVPYDRGDLMSRIHAEADLLSTEHRGDGTLVHAKVHPGLRAELEPFRV